MRPQIYQDIDTTSCKRADALMHALSPLNAHYLHPKPGLNYIYPSKNICHPYSKQDKVENSLFRPKIDGGVIAKDHTFVVKGAGIIKTS